MLKRVGVLALQGAFIEHVKILAVLGVKASEIRLPEQLQDLDGLIIPGGESTTISRLMHEWNLVEPIRTKAKQGMAIWGTCAGAILLAERGANLQHHGLELMDITIARNAFGRQIDSFIADLHFPAIGKKPFAAVFIRAPIITEVGPKAKTLITLDDGTVVAAQQIGANGRSPLLATSFHPELTDDPRLHEYFLGLL